MAKILIVEYHKNLRALYGEVFRSEGFEVILAKEGDEAIQKLKSGAPEVVILDDGLPNRHVCTTIKKMLKINGNLSIIINSAYVNIGENPGRCYAKRYVLKSSDLTELKNKVFKLMHV